MSFFSRTSFQPKRQFRFLVNFSQIADIDFMCTKAAKPSYKMGEGVSHKILNHTFKFPGTVTWDDIKIDFIDAIEPNVGSKFYNMLVNSGYLQPTSFSNLLQGITKQSANAALGTVRILQLDGGVMGPAPGLDPGASQGISEGTSIIEEWTLNNAYIKDVAFGTTLDYAQPGIVSVGTTITYDWASYNGQRQDYAGSATIV